MADIRQNPTVIDAFDYGASETYLSALNSNWTGGVSGLAAPLWYDVDQDGYARTHSPTDTRALSSWTPLVLDGDDQEVWAHEIGGTGSGKSWRLALTKDHTPGSPGTVSGYSFTISVGTGGGSWFIRKYVNSDVGTVIASGVGGPPTANPGWCLLRRSGNNIQAYRADSGGEDTDSWTQIYSVADTTFMTGLMPTLWLGDDAVQGHGYDYFGGGPYVPTRAQIYRWLPGRQGEPI